MSFGPQAFISPTPESEEEKRFDRFWFLPQMVATLFVTDLTATLRDWAWTWTLARPGWTFSALALDPVGAGLRPCWLDPGPARLDRRGLGPEPRTGWPGPLAPSRSILARPAWTALRSNTRAIPRAIPRAIHLKQLKQKLCVRPLRRRRT